MHDATKFIVVIAVVGAGICAALPFRRVDTENSSSNATESGVEDSALAAADDGLNNRTPGASPVGLSLGVSPAGSPEDGIGGNGGSPPGKHAPRRGHVPSIGVGPSGSGPFREAEDSPTPPEFPARFQSSMDTDTKPPKNQADKKAVESARKGETLRTPLEGEETAGEDLTNSEVKKPRADSSTSEKSESKVAGDKKSQSGKRPAKKSASKKQPSKPDVSKSSGDTSEVETHRFSDADAAKMSTPERKKLAQRDAEERSGHDESATRMPMKIPSGETAISQKAASDTPHGMSNPRAELAQADGLQRDAGPSDKLPKTNKRDDRQRAMPDRAEASTFGSEKRPADTVAEKNPRKNAWSNESPEVTTDIAASGPCEKTAKSAPAESDVLVARKTARPPAASLPAGGLDGRESTSVANGSGAHGGGFRSGVRTVPSVPPAAARPPVRRPHDGDPVWRVARRDDDVQPRDNMTATAASPLAPSPISEDMALGDAQNVRHRVVDGDSLMGLAERYLGDRNRYMEIFQANRNALASPDILPIGVALIVPVHPGSEAPSPRASQSQNEGIHIPRNTWVPADQGLVPIPADAFPMMRR